MINALPELMTLITEAGWPSAQAIGFRIRTGLKVVVVKSKAGSSGVAPREKVQTTMTGPSPGDTVHITVDARLSKAQIDTVIAKQLNGIEDRLATVTKRSQLHEALGALVEESDKPKLSLASAITPGPSVPAGILVHSVNAVWFSIVNELRTDWSKAYTIESRVWEEIIAGAFDRAGYDEVILTPRSNDKGRDVIATKNGFGSVRVLGSVKRYAPGRLITRAQVDELLGTLSREASASKGVLTTTSDFAPGVMSDPTFKALMPTRLELINGPGLQALFRQLTETRPLKLENPF